MGGISVVLGDREIARIDEEGNFKQLVEFKGLAQPSVRQLYEDCLLNKIPIFNFLNTGSSII